MVKVSIVQALADCLETLRQGSGLDVALARCPEYRAQLKALLEVASLIRPLAEDVTPPSALRESIRAHLLELQDKPTPSLFHPGGEASEANWRAGQTPMGRTTQLLYGLRVASCGISRTGPAATGSGPRETTSGFPSSADIVEVR